MMLDELMCNNNIQKYDAPNQTANQNIQSIDIASFLLPYFNVVVLWFLIDLVCTESLESLLWW